MGEGTGDMQDGDICELMAIFFYSDHVLNILRKTLQKVGHKFRNYKFPRVVRDHRPVVECCCACLVVRRSSLQMSGIFHCP